MKHTIIFSIRHPWTVAVLTALLCIVGVWSAKHLPLDAVPDITNLQVQVSTQVEGLAPEQIEKLVTHPVEVAVSGIPRAIQVRSITRPNLSQVTVVFEDGADLYRCRQLIAERLRNAEEELPEGMVPRIGPIATGLGEIYFYTLEARQPATGEARVRQLMELRSLQDWVIRPRLVTVPGVAEVNVIGGYERQAVVQPNPAICAGRGISLLDVVEALKRANRNVGGGMVEQGGEGFSVAATGALTSLDEIRRVVIRRDEGDVPVSIGDVAQVRWMPGFRAGTATVNGNEALVCNVIMLAGANSRTVSSSVDARVRQVSQALPDWVELKTIYDRTDLVDATLGTVSDNLLYGAILVILVLVVLMGNWRAGVITAVTIPLAMLGALTVMTPLGLSGNLMSLGAIDFGILVGGAVFVMDKVMLYVGQRRRRVKRQLSHSEIRAAVLDATMEVRVAAGFGQLVTIIPLLTLFGLSGVEGKTFTPMVASLSLALAFAFLVSFSVTPALACLLLTTSTGDREPWVIRRLSEAYKPVLSWAMSRPVVLLTAAVLMVGGSWFTYGRLGAVFMPQLDEGSIAFQFIRPVTIGMGEAVRFQEASERLILEYPEVRDVFARLGTAEVAFDACGVDLADTTVTLKPADEWPLLSSGHRRDKAALVEEMSKRLSEEIPGQGFIVTQPIQLRFNELLEGTRADVAIKVFGDDLEKISDIARKIAGIVEGIRGAADVELEQRGAAPTLSVQPKGAILASMGLSPGAIHEAVEIGLGGEQTGLVYDGARRYPLVTRLAPEYRSDPRLMMQLPVRIGAATTVPLGELAALAFIDSFPSVSREQAKRRAAVMANPRGRDVESFVLEAKAAVEKALSLPEGYYIEWGGSFQNLKDARTRLMLLTPMAIGLVLLMIYATLRNVPMTLLVLACVPFALVGGVLTLFLRGIPFSISAGVGFIALAGIAVLNGVVLVSTGLNFRRRGAKAGVAEMAAANTCLRPVFMTALVEILGFLPMMFSHGIGAEVQQPLASVVVGGVISSSLLILVMLPSWQAWLDRQRYTSGPPSDDALEQRIRTYQ